MNQSPRLSISRSLCRIGWFVSKKWMKSLGLWVSFESARSPTELSGDGNDFMHFLTLPIRRKRGFISMYLIERKLPLWNSAPSLHQGFCLPRVRLLSVPDRCQVEFDCPVFRPVFRRNMQINKRVEIIRRETIFQMGIPHSTAKLLKVLVHQPPPHLLPSPDGLVLSEIKTHNPRFESFCQTKSKNRSNR